MDTIEKLQSILRQMDSNSHLYVKNSQADFTRKRKVTFYELMSFLLFLGANAMTEEIRQAFSHKNFEFISAPAIFKSRSKIKLSAFEHILREFNSTLAKPKTYKDCRLLAIDGSDFSSLYSAQSEFATISNQYGGANRMHISFAYDILNKSFLDCVVEAKNKADERKAALSLLSKLDCREKILAIMDRGYDGIKMIEHCNRIENLSYLIRMRSTKMKEIAALPDKQIDTDLTFTICQKGAREPYQLRPKAWDMELPCSVLLRLVKFKVGNDWEVLATNLPRSEFPVRELKKVYKARWKIETAFRDLKHSLASLHFHSKKDLFNLQEIFAHIIRYNLTTRIIQETTVKAKSKYRYEINFKNACFIIKFCWRGELDYKNMLLQIGRYLHPIRPNRHYPRPFRYKYPVSFNYRVA